MDTNIYGFKEIWTCERAGYYRGQPAMCGDFSADGKLAVGFGHTATFWDFDEHRMTMAMSVLPEDKAIRKLEFGVASDEKHLIAVLSDQNLATWDISSQLCLWRVTTKPDLVCRDMSSGLFAAFFGPKICLFRLSSPEPTSVITSKDFTCAIAAVFGSNLEKENDQTAEVSPLYFINDDQRLLCLRKPGSEKEEDEVPSEKTNARTPFAELLAASKASKRKNEPINRGTTYETNMQLLSGASHTLPGVAIIGPKFAESCLVKKEPNRQHEDAVLPDISSEITFATLRNTYAR